MNRLLALTRLDGLIQGRWNAISQIKANGHLTKAQKREWSNQHKLDIEALQMARDALKNPGYAPTHVHSEGQDGEYPV